jgi:hypothetical protein
VVVFFAVQADWRYDVFCDYAKNLLDQLGRKSFKQAVAFGRAMKKESS